MRPGEVGSLTKRAVDRRGTDHLGRCIFSGSACRQVLCPNVASKLLPSRTEHLILLGVRVGATLACSRHHRSRLVISAGRRHRLGRPRISKRHTSHRAGSWWLTTNRTVRAAISDGRSEARSQFDRRDRKDSGRATPPVRDGAIKSAVKRSRDLDRAGPTGREVTLAGFARRAAVPRSIDRTA